LLKQVYLNQQFVPDVIHVPADFEDRETLEEWLTERRGKKVEIHTPQRGEKKALLDLVANNAKHSFESRFRVRKPAAAAISEALRDHLGLEAPPERIECFDISHTQGTDQVASMVVWEKGRMKKSDYRRFLIKTVAGNDDFAAMREVVARRYRRVQEEGGAMPGLILIDGGIGQLHAASEALDAVGVMNQPLASIAKKEEIIYVLGREDEPIALDRFSPVLHLVQTVRDEAHRFAVTFHRQRRSKARLTSELLALPGVGPKTAQKLLREIGGLEQVKAASEEQLAAVVGPGMAAKIREALPPDGEAA
jgi:excinuclease ABC subunit C